MIEFFLEENEKFIQLMDKHKVDYILIGGYAVIFHGYNRTTGDMDVWLRPDNNNKLKFIGVLKDFGIIDEDIYTLEKLEFSNTLVFHIGEDPYKIEFLTKIQGVDFRNAFNKRIFLNFNGIQVPFLHLNDLIASKMVSSRAKDKADIEELQKVLKLKKKN